jgi:hypothetical protein
MRRIIVILLFMIAIAMPGRLLAEKKDETARALSLRTLQERIQECSDRKRPCPSEILQMGGLTRIEGFFLDEENRDLILFGEADPTLPAINTEDFAVALRNAWLKYAQQEGNNIYYSNPGCSIDMDPKILRRLNSFSKKPTVCKSKEQSALFHKTCRMPQNVRVLGIPFHSHFGKVMVDADYQMKRLVDGSVSTGVDGFESLTDLTLKNIKSVAASGQPFQGSSFNRFWFYPGDYKYRFGSDMVFIEACPVILLTEAQYLSRSERIEGTGMADQLALQFCSSFTGKYSEIAKCDPIFRQLEELFRLVAVAKAMKYRNIGGEDELGYLLNGFKVAEVKVSATLSGISKVKEVNAGPFYTCLQTCGGVGIDIEPQKKDFVPARELANVKRAILAHRPSATTLFWDFPRSIYGKLEWASVMILEPEGKVSSGKETGERPKTKEPVRHETPEKGKSLTSSPLEERKRDALRAAGDLGNSVVLDIYVDQQGKPHLTIADSRGKMQEPNDLVAGRFMQLLSTTESVKGKFGKKLLDTWEAFQRDYLAGSAKKSQLTLPDGRTVKLKPLLLIRSSEVNLRYANLEKVPALADNFIIFIASKTGALGEVSETTAEELSRKIRSVPAVSKKNIVFAIRPPKTGMTEEMRREWEGVVLRLESQVGRENILFNPSKEEFTHMLKDRSREVIVIELTHTEDVIKLKGNEEYSSRDLKQLDLSHIKYLIAGIGTCSLPKLENGEFVGALRRCGVGLVNASYREVSNQTVIRRLKVLIRILESTEQCNFPAYYLIDIIDQLIDVIGADTLNLGKVEPPIKRGNSFPKALAMATRRSFSEKRLHQPQKRNLYLENS